MKKTTLIAAIIVALIAMSTVFIACGDPDIPPPAPRPKHGENNNGGSQQTAAVETGSITGVVKFEGKAPPLKTLSMAADPVCASKHTTPVLSEALVLGEGNTMANIFVKIADDNVPEGDYPVPTKPFVVTQAGCKYSPHVFAIRLGQKLKLLNPDGTLHNVHGRPKNNSEYNESMPKFVKETFIEFSNAETTPYSVKCDAHPWMEAYHAILEHPFFDVTEKDGKFTIKDLPAGTYKLMAWHEKLGYQEQSVTVKAKETVTADFTFAKK